MHDREILCGLKSYTGLTDADMGSLVKPMQAFFDIVVMTYKTTQAISPSLLCQSGIWAQIEPKITPTDPVKHPLHVTAN